MRVTTSYREFNREIKKVRDYRVLAKLGLWPESLVGYFVESNVEQVLELCEWDKSYHVVSYMGGFTLNRFQPGGVLYWLAEGNADPDFILDDRHEEAWILQDLRLEVGEKKASTIISRLKRGE